MHNLFITQWKHPVWFAREDRSGLNVQFFHLETSQSLSCHRVKWSILIYHVPRNGIRMIKFNISLEVVDEVQLRLPRVVSSTSI